MNEQYINPPCCGDIESPEDVLRWMSNCPTDIAWEICYRFLRLRHPLYEVAATAYKEKTGEEWAPF